MGRVVGFPSLVRVLKKKKFKECSKCGFPLRYADMNEREMEREFAVDDTTYILDVGTLDQHYYKTSALLCVKQQTVKPSIVVTTYGYGTVPTRVVNTSATLRYTTETEHTASTPIVASPHPAIFHLFACWFPFKTCNLGSGHARVSIPPRQNASKSSCCLKWQQRAHAFVFSCLRDPRRLVSTILLCWHQSDVITFLSQPSSYNHQNDVVSIYPRYYMHM